MKSRGQYGRAFYNIQSPLKYVRTPATRVLYVIYSSLKNITTPAIRRPILLPWVLEHSILLKHSVLFARLFGLVAILKVESKELKMELDVIICLWNISEFPPVWIVYSSQLVK